jgi:nitrite reductase/ring-hydroxylating ferredoxin subunit
MDALDMDTSVSDFVRAGTLEELKAKGRLVLRGHHRPILLVYENEHVFALDNRCRHMGFPLDRGSIEDGILTDLSLASRPLRHGQRLHLRSLG